MRTIHKVHGSGNTFYLYETTDEQQFDWFELGKFLCHPKNDGGADGLLLITPSQKATAKMRVINADGSEASMCGNGLRCVARYVLEKHQLEHCIIETMKADLYVSKEKDLLEGIPTYAVEISPIDFELTSLPMVYKNKQTIIHELIPEFSDKIFFTAVSVPNPHLIGIVSDADIKDRTHHEKLASMLNGANAYTPDGVNVSYLYPITNEEIYVRTYERGVGFTNACGTAMTASALVATKVGIAKEGVVTVYNPGGFVKCEVLTENGHTSLRLIGNATFTHRYKLEGKTTWLLTDQQHTDEQQKYEQLIQYTAQKLEHLIE